MGLNQAQKRAVEYLEGPLLVLAGPGTGKTQLLSEKVAYILKNTDANAENILCLTFTETGASNMRERLKSLIGKDALKVSIGTYHAFGQEILTQYKNYATDYDRRLDTALDEVKQFKLVKEIQEGLPAMDILRGDPVKDIVSVISEAKAAGLSADDLQMVAEKNMDDSRVLSETISPFLLAVVPRKFQESLDAAYTPILQILKAHADDPPMCGNVRRTVVLLAASLKEAYAEALSSGKITPLTKWRNDYFEKDDEGDYRLKDVVANKKLLSVAKVMREYERRLLGEGLFDFDDMIEEAVEALRRDKGFKATLEEKYQYIMLDEFQDTNPSQLEIVKQLTDYEKPMVMAVGDDDQAIYEFQGALSSNLADFQAYYNAEVVALTENYRSTGEILELSRQVIEQAPDRFVPEKALTPHKPDFPTSQIHRYEFISSDMEFGFVAEKIAELVREGVPQREIAVISAKHKYFEPLLPYLKAYPEIKIAYEKRDDLFEDDKIHQVLTILQYVYEKANGLKPTVQLMEILSYPCFNLKMLEVVVALEKARSEHKSAFEYLAEAASGEGGAEPHAKISEEMRETMKFLADLIAASYEQPVASLLFEVAEKMKPALGQEYERFEFYENLAALTGKLKRYAGEKPLRLRDLVEMVADYTAADMALTTTSPYRDAEEAVSILTAHKAKGLEFEHVFIIAADHTAWGKGKGNNNFLVLPKNLLHIRHTGTTDGEKLRVLYVALTRAKSALYITNAITDFNGKSPERLEYLEERVEKTDEGEVIVSPFIPEGQAFQVLTERDFDKKERNVKNWLTTKVVNAPDMREFYKDAMRQFRMSASALTTFVDLQYGGPEKFFERYVMHVPELSDSFNLAFGNLMHATFEKVTNEKLDTEAAISYYLEEAEKYDTNAKNKQELREKGPVNIVAALEEFGEIIRGGLAEVNFSSERMVVDGVPISGKIDHIVVDEVSRTIEVYDFKTGNFHAEKWQSHPTLYQYMLQLEFYKLLLNNSRKYRGYRVTRGHILFVVKDKNDEKVHDKVYEFNEGDFTEFLALLKAVHMQATSLEFLDDSELFVPADKNNNMKKIREFIELMLEKSAEK